MRQPPSCYPAELREGRVRMVSESRSDHDSEWAVMTQVGQLIGDRALRDRVDQAEAAVEGPRRSRDRHPSKGRLVQPQPALRVLRRPHITGRSRAGSLRSPPHPDAGRSLTPESLRTRRGGSPTRVTRWLLAEQEFLRWSWRATLGELTATESLGPRSWGGEMPITVDRGTEIGPWGQRAGQGSWMRCTGTAVGSRR